jgi:hypothetical protein
MTQGAYSSGTTAALTISTELQVITITTAGTYQFKVGLNNMAGGGTPDILIFRPYEKLLSGDAAPGALLDELTVHQGVGTGLAWLSKPYGFAFSGTFALVQTGGTGRAYAWQVFQYAP